MTYFDSVTFHDDATIFVWKWNNLFHHVKDHHGIIHLIIALNISLWPFGIWLMIDFLNIMTIFITQWHSWYLHFSFINVCYSHMFMIFFNATIQCAYPYMKITNENDSPGHEFMTFSVMGSCFIFSVMSYRCVVKGLRVSRMRTFVVYHL